MADVLRARAAAKVNLVLEVLGRRDDGYHELDTVLQELELADDLELSFGARPGVLVEGKYAVGTPADESNLAWRAASALAAASGHDCHDLQIRLDKRVPPAGGLGGGASDAATVLRLLGGAWGARADDISRAAEAVGSDVPFFLTGGTARAQGRGERITHLRALPRRAVVLFVPAMQIEHKTARAFAALDALPFDPGGVAEAFVLDQPRRFESADVHNAFERVAFDLFDGLGALWAELEARVNAPIRLAGAGPTLFWIGGEPDAARVVNAARALACDVIATRTAITR